MNGSDKNDVLIEVRNLRTHFHLDEGVLKAVEDVSFNINRRKVLGVVGESGSGKSVAAESILRITPPPGRIDSGEILLRREGAATVDITKLKASGAEIRAIRGGEVSMIFQEPMTSLAPVYTIGAQIMEALLLHQKVTKKEARQLAIDTLDKVGIPDPELRLDSYPHELSGGLRQRAMIAMALSCRPSLLIADEPTTALDVTVQAQILDLMKELQGEFGMAILFITHNLGAIAEMADEVLVMYLGKIVERGDVATIFHEPRHPYTRGLLEAIPKLGKKSGQHLASIKGSVPLPINLPTACAFYPRCPYAMRGKCDKEEPVEYTVGENHTAKCFLYEESGAGLDAITRLKAKNDAIPPHLKADNGDKAPLLEVENVSKHFPIEKGLLKRQIGAVKAVDGVSLYVNEGEALGLVGESGCGKTTLGRCIMRAFDVTDGKVIFRPEEGQSIDMLALKGEELRLKRRLFQMIFQDPYSSLDPRMTVLDIVGEPLTVNGIARGKELEERVKELVDLVGLNVRHLKRYPHAFSGGQRQRIGIARALALNPKLIICDEAVSALDVSIQAQILNLLQDLQARLGLTYVFISHDLSVVEHISDRVAVMYVGKIVEMAPTQELFTQPIHPYTEALLSAVPTPDPAMKMKRIRLEGDVPSPANPPAGCYFHPRCRYAQKVCWRQAPPWEEIAHGHFAACHFAKELELQGVGDGAEA